jgi:hypothetical protein
MKKLLFTLLLLVSIASFGAAQSVFQLNPTPASNTGTIDQPDVPVDAHITNMTANTIHMKWERNVINLTPGCETAVCDPNICWARHVNTKNFDMDPNEVGQMLVHFYNNGAACEGIVHLRISNLDNPADTVIGIYLFNQASSTKDLPAANVKLFPNPVVDFFTLENAADVATVRVFALNGAEVATFNTNEHQVFSLIGQPAGNYVLALQDKNGQTFQAMQLKKQ